MICHAQEFSIQKLELAGEKLLIHYDLIDTARDHTYSIFVYSSKDNFTTPLQKIAGDIGIEVRPGTNRKIVWEAKQELGASFDGEIELEVKGKLYVPFIKLSGFEKINSMKRGVPIILKWSGGTPRNVMNFQLFRGDKLAASFPNAPNEGQYKLTIPTNVKAGGNYIFRITDARNTDQIVKTNVFSIKRKYPLLLKVIPVAAIAVAAKFLLVKSSTPDLGNPPSVPATH